MEVFFLLLFLAASLTQVILLLFIFSTIIFHRQANTQTPSRGISVIIAAHNEKKNLERLVPVLIQLEHPDFEIIIANDRSTDGTMEYLKSIHIPFLKVVNIDKQAEGINPKKYALTKAIEAAENEFLILTDADCLPASEKWLAEMESCLEDKKEIVLGYSPYLPGKGFLNLFIRFDTFLTGVQYLSFALIGKPYMGVGRNLGYFKNIFKNNEGFKEHQEHLGGDDDLFIGKVANCKNTTISINHRSQVYSFPKSTWKDYRKQKIRHLSAGRRYTGLNKFIAGLFPGSAIVLYFSMFFLSFYNINFSYILSIFLLRTLVLIIIFALITRKLQETIKWFWLPVLDLIYIVYYLSTGFSTIFSKNIKWR